MRSLALVWVVLFVGCGLVRGFYIPGFAPNKYEEGAKLDVYADKLYSSENKVPYDYFSLPFCQKSPQSLRQQHLSIGEMMLGDRDELTSYDIRMQVNASCSIYCDQQVVSSELQTLRSMIDDDYFVQLNIDDMPAVTKFGADGNEFIHFGYPIGYAQADRYFLYNHLEFKILIHKPELSLEDISDASDKCDNCFRVVGIEVTPSSVNWDVDISEIRELSNDKSECDKKKNNKPVELFVKDPEGQWLVFTYEVTFEESDLKWATRWDPLMNADPALSNVAWLYVINPVAIMFFFAIVVAGILLRTIYLDFARYNNLEEATDVEEETGWKQLHGDVFRPAPFRGALSVACGAGAQLAVIMFVTLLFAQLGYFSPVFRGALLSALIGFWVVTSFIAGFVSARTYTMLGGTQKRMVTTGSAFFLSGALFSVFFISNLVLSLAGSSAAVPFFTLVTLLLIWLVVSVPLNVLGAFFGYKMEPVELPTKVNPAHRPIPEYSFMGPTIYVIASGVIPFGIVFIELKIILDSLWQNNIFYLFNILFVIFFVLIVTCAEVSVVLAYLLLCREDWRWWWPSFFASGSSGLYVFCYSVYFIVSHGGLKGIHFSSTFMFTSYSLLLSVCFTLFTGTLGFFATLVLVRRLYTSVHID
ncbi:hypothetical protein NDN08_007713 [Rhodosorus marinus]|uniref:Transmembrane 9 superfamily member n=1 Tax=Rhodosorus marinus TaxID=101924 RepID=A0AAV8V154_9RHOD|nr:hypothetical protein NDN08_007713 [Rhodosorus marinus]